MHTIYSVEQAKSRLQNFKDKPFLPFQEETVNWVMNGTKKFRFVKAKTGFGKSLCAMVCGLMAGDLTYLVSSKFLQTQITGDFGDSIVSLWGRNNYQCLLDTTRNCNECVSSENSPCDRKTSCLYTLAKQKAIESSYRLTNFAYFLSEIAYVGRMSGNPFVVIDEADSLQQSLDSFISLSFSERSLYRLGLPEGPRYKTATAKQGISSWKEFAQEAQARSSEMCKNIQREVDGMSDSEPDAKLYKMKELEGFVHINERCKIFLDNVDQNWVMQQIPRYGSRQGKLIFSPTWITHELADRYLWNHADTFVLISATFLPIEVECKRLGIDIDDVEDRCIHEVPSTFDPEKSPVHLWPVADLKRDTMEASIPILANAVKKILSWHEGSRGLMHTVSFSLCQKVMDAVNSPRLITHTSENRQEVIDNYIKGFDKDAPDDIVLCSPSSGRGIDLKYDLCSFIICLKMPWLNLGDKIISARANSGELGKLWFSSSAMAEVEQQCGRGSRAIDDSVTIYIIDEQVEKIYLLRPSLFSASFREQIYHGSGKNLLLED